MALLCQGADGRLIYCYTEIGSRDVVLGWLPHVVRNHRGPGNLDKSARRFGLRVPPLHPLYSGPFVQSIQPQVVAKSGDVGAERVLG